MTTLHRRQFLTWGLTGTAAILSARCSRGVGFGQIPFGQPPENPSLMAHRSQSGLLNVTLQAQEQQVTLANQTATLLAYNGQVPGPYLEAKAGNTVQITFENQLAQTSNLHFHGLHIPPTGNADNVFLAVPPGERQQYEFVIPEDHPGGLFWYHPHHHGVVAEQVAGGLAGAFVVRGQVDEIPEIQAAQEAILVLQDFDINRRGQLQEPMPMFRRWGRQGNLITANGDLAPEFQIPQSGLLRLRLLNASPSRIYRLRLENHPWHLIGLDGGTLPEPTEIEDLMLAPGERADILVTGNREPNTYALVSLPYDRGIAGMMSGMGRRHHHGAGLDTAPRILARLSYGEATNSDVPLPKTLIPAMQMPEPIRRREFVLDHGISHGQFFLINGSGFEHDHIDTTVQLGTVEDWHIINQAGMDHPFHIHTNAFQVLRQDDAPFPFQCWKDVVNVKAYGSADLRIAFTDFPGKTVYHCHILDHEDQGMMGILELQPEPA